TSPLLETTIDGAHGVIISITASPDVGLDEVTQASEIIAGAAHPDANIIWGVSFDTALQDESIVTVVATGFGTDGFKYSKAAKEVADDKKEKAADEITNIMASDDDIMGFGDDDTASSGSSFGMDDGYFDALDDIFSSRS
ncbi:MAG: cell division protein FtsZ, partial [Clostridia bacterium]|nr:cell division protein FtsZ [Clostridia bacterium]